MIHHCALRRRLRAPVLGAAIAAVCCASACGRKGNPLPPLRPVPAPVTEVAVVRRDAGVQIAFRLPQKNVDGTTPVAIDKVDIYAMSVGEDGPAPTAAVLRSDAHLVKSLPVRQPTDEDSEDAADTTDQNNAAKTADQVKKDAIPGPGDLMTWSETMPPAPPPVPLAARGASADTGRRGGRGGRGGAASASAAIPPPLVTTPPTAGDLERLLSGAAPAMDKTPPRRYYLVVPMVGHRAGTASDQLVMPMTPPPAAPVVKAPTYDEKTITLTWTSPAAGQKFRVYAVKHGAAEHEDLLTAAPLAAAEFKTDVVFGTERCFVVRTVEATGAVSIESAPAAAECVTPVDTFPPAAPVLLPVVATPGAVNLIWNAVDAPDLAGYLVLRGEAPGDRLLPLVTQPMTATTYTDSTARPGTDYFYAIVAVDKSGNASAQSNRQTVTARIPE